MPKDLRPVLAIEDIQAMVLTVLILMNAKLALIIAAKMHRVMTLKVLINVLAAKATPEMDLTVLT